MEEPAIEDGDEITERGGPWTGMDDGALGGDSGGGAVVDADGDDDMITK